MNLSQNDTMKTRVFTAILTLIFGAETASAAVNICPTRQPAAINRAAQVMVRPSQIFDNGSLLSPELIQTYQEMKKNEKPETYAEIIPENIESYAGSDQVVAAMADRGLSKWWNSDAVKSSAFGRRAEAVEKKMQGEVIVQSKEIQHKLNFNFQAFQTRAKIDYSGLTNASLYYQARNSEMGLEITEKISDRQDLVVSHSVKLEQVSQVNLRWAW